jgi:Leucine-rich repeat (LRR) protein
VANNSLSGEVPWKVLHRLSELSLTDLDLSKNKFTIEILPEVVFQMTNLRKLGLESLQIAGTISKFSNFANLVSLKLRNNKFTGEIPHLENCTKLQKLDLAHNQLAGAMPSLILHTRLKELDLSGNLAYGGVKLKDDLRVTAPRCIVVV